MRLIKFIKRLVIIIITITLLTVGSLYLTGKKYLVKGIINTYLVGKTGPDITDLFIFPYRAINTDKPSLWNRHSGYNSTPFTDKELNYLDSIETSSFLIVKDSNIYFEQYWENFPDTLPTNSFSMAKSVVGLLIGIAIDEGKIDSLNTPISKYLPEYKNTSITIEHLLWMSSGLSWKESGKDPFSDNAKAYYGDDLKKLILSQKSIESPGKVFNYLSGNSALLALIIERATGKNVSEYAQEKIWKPLNMEHISYWSLDNDNGFEKAYCCLYAIPRDYARLGQLILNKGTWEGDTIISLKYLEQTFSPAPIKEEDGAPNTRYGLHWWLGEYNGEYFYHAQGILGQYIIILPESNIVIVRTGRKRDKTEHNGLPIDIYEYIRITKRMISNS